MSRAIVLTFVDHDSNRFVELCHWPFATAEDLEAHWRAVPDGFEHQNGANCDLIADRHDHDGLTDNKVPSREWAETRLGMTVEAAIACADKRDVADRGERP